MRRRYTSLVRPRLGIISLVLLCFATLPSTAEDQPRIAILDFGIQSDNPQFKYLGKGFAEFIAVELAQVRGIKLIDREKRNAILDEQAFAVSGAVSADAGSRIGNMLSATHLLSGDIFDLFGQLAITIKVLNVESGQVVVSKQADGPPKDYKLLVRQLSSAVVASLEVAAQPEVVKKPAVEIAQAQAEEVLTAFSEAVDAVDNNDVETARIRLKRALKLDSTDRAVKYYLSKLAVTSPKFNVELIYYAPSYNPASLGFADKDRFYLTASTNFLKPYDEQFPGSGDIHRDFSWEVVDGLYHDYVSQKIELGYLAPVGRDWGFGGEATIGQVDNISRDQNYTIPTVGPDGVYLRSVNAFLGGRVSGGHRISDQLGLGASAFLYVSQMNLGGQDSEDDPRSNTFSGSASVGAYSRLLDERLTADILLTVPFIQEVYLDYDILDYVAYKTAPYPVVLEATGIYGALEGKLYIAFKEVLEVYTSFGDDERTGVASRSIPAVEWWPYEVLSARLGFEYDFLTLMGKTENGFGVLGGISWRQGRFSVDANYTLLQRALRFYPGLTAPDGTLLIQFSWSGAFVKERQQ